MFERLQRSYRSEAALGLRAGESGIESLPYQLLNTQIEMERDFRIHIAPAGVAPAKHEVEEPAHAGPDEWHVSALAR